MAEPKSARTPYRRHFSARESADDHRQRQDYTAGATGEQQISLEGQMGPDEISEPEEVVRNNEAKDHSERASASTDQDIDTAGQIPGNKATDTP